MKLKYFVKYCTNKIDKEFQELEIRGVAHNSNNVKKNFLFVAIKGFQTDGHNFIDDAIEKGAITVAVEPHYNYKKNFIQYKTKKIPILRTKNNRIFLSKISALFYDYPSLKLNVIGITGTNGKTTVSYLTEHILKSAGYNTGLIGTINYKINNRRYSALTTTPESLDLQQLLARMLDSNVKYVSMEVSSHSLKLHRVDDCHFKVAIFTNLSEDHFDFHKNYKDYFESKAKLFELLKDSRLKNRFGIVNIDDRWGRLLYRRFNNKIKLFTYGINEKADFSAYNISLSLSCTRFDIKHRNRTFSIQTPLIGKFNVYNVLVAFATSFLLRIPVKTIIDSIKRFKPPAGRMEIIKSRGIYIGIDYAHTDDALKNVLSSVRNITEGRIITIFGCGGDRDRKKRPRMGRVAARLSDIVIVTSDNPRTEDPEKIIDEIEKGVLKIRSTNYYRIVDRKEAIKKGMQLATPGDFVLIAGKGHEDYQIIGTKKLPFSDREVVKEILKSGGNYA